MRVPTSKTEVKTTDTSTVIVDNNNLHHKDQGGQDAKSISDPRLLRTFCRWKLSVNLTDCVGIRFSPHDDSRIPRYLRNKPF